MGAVEQLIQVAAEVSRRTPGFFDVKGPGDGNRATNTFMAELREQVAAQIRGIEPEQTISGDNNLAVDFVAKADGVAVEVALGLHYPNSEFEKDILKVVMAKDAGLAITRLVFIAKPGAAKRHHQPSSRAVIAWARKVYGLTVEIHELMPSS